MPVAAQLALRSDEAIERLRVTPSSAQVIAASTGEAPHVIDRLLDHESGIAIREHATDTAGSLDHVFGLCHLLRFRFRFAPRIRDLCKHRLYAMSDFAPWPTLRPLVAGPVNLCAIEEDWDETLRLAPLIRADTVRASVCCATSPAIRARTRSHAPCARVGGSSGPCSCSIGPTMPSCAGTTANLNKG